MTRTVAALALALAVSRALAHHSFAPHFDSSKPVTITGEIIEFEPRNPHAYLNIAARGRDGEMHRYRCESHGVTMLTRNGIDRSLLTPGTAVSVTGSQHRRDEYMCFFDTIRIGDGPVLSVNGNRGSRPAVPDTDSAAGIFGNWLLVPANRSTSGPNSMMSYLTPEGEAATAAYDPFVDDPTYRCDPVAIRRVWFAPGTPLEISRDGNKVLLRHEWMDVERVVHLDLDSHPADTPRSSLGHSIGRFENDTLVIDTASYSEGVLRQYVEQPDGSMRGLLHSDALRSTERIRFDPDLGQLEVTIELRDPVFFTREFPPATAHYAPTELAIEPFGCIPEILK
jgi:hypothetical protein